MNKHFSIGEALKFGWATFKSNVWFFLLMFVILFAVNLISIPINLLAESASPGPTASASVAVVNIAIVIIQTIIGLGFVNISIKFANGDKPRLADLFNVYPLFFKYLLGGILAGLIILVGLILFIIPGIIWSLKFAFFTYFIVDQKMGPIKALKASANLTYGVKWKLLGFIIISALLNFLGILLLFVGLIVTSSVLMVAQAFIYRQLLSQIQPVPVPAPASTPPPTTLADPATASA